MKVSVIGGGSTYAEVNAAKTHIKRQLRADMPVIVRRHATLGSLRDPCRSARRRL